MTHFLFDTKCTRCRGDSHRWILLKVKPTHQAPFRVSTGPNPSRAFNTASSPAPVRPSSAIRSINAGWDLGFFFKCRSTVDRAALTRPSDKSSWNRVSEPKRRETGLKETIKTHRMQTVACAHLQPTWSLPYCTVTPSTTSPLQGLGDKQDKDKKCRKNPCCPRSNPPPVASPHSKLSIRCIPHLDPTASLSLL